MERKTYREIEKNRSDGVVEAKIRKGFLRSFGHFVATQLNRRKVAKDRNRTAVGERLSVCVRCIMLFFMANKRATIRIPTEGIDIVHLPTMQQQKQYPLIQRAPPSHGEMEGQQCTKLSFVPRCSGPQKYHNLLFPF